MAKNFRQYKPGEPYACADCGTMIVNVFNPDSGKNPPVNRDSWNGERNYTKGTHTVHMWTCPRYTGKHHAVVSSNRINELYVINEFYYPFMHPTTNAWVYLKFAFGEVLRLDVPGKFFRGGLKVMENPRVEIYPKWEKERFIGKDGELLEKPSQYLSSTKPGLNQTQIQVSPGIESVLAHPIAQLIVNEFDCVVV